VDYILIGMIKQSMDEAKKEKTLNTFELVKDALGDAIHFLKHDITCKCDRILGDCDRCVLIHELTFSLSEFQREVDLHANN
jgi:hypothetical protein